MIHYNILLKEKILPAVTFNSIDEVLPVAEAILRGGLSIVEIAFRSKVAAESITIIKKNFPEMSVGAGTLLTVNQVEQAVNAGAEFGLAPGFNPVTCKSAREKKLPFIPGVMTPSEIELASTMSFDILKLFPAAQLGGADFLRAIDGPYGQLNLQFIPMGGVNLSNLNEYLKLKNVIAVGGSWLATRALIESKNYPAIRRNVEEALNKVAVTD
ncbi:MAG TPA: bifunctional 4-hydroxy-2-oxoglutarate aldolase/2-dehydro-3-deoxy-phosphogluconate aldolase [Cyclobacteriaceae bacterium]|nr:bifunctional 4-hydroxy-2-oxoglutarate aldolase/2-dehydro-3-deoxy-phosphogluconate aldolase [Cyclobacteriaceae bacterium]